MDNMTISALCTEQIVDDYWHATYVNLKVVMMKSNGYVNASKLCRDFGNRYKDWTRLKSVKQRMKRVGARLEQECGIAIPLTITINVTDRSPTDYLISGTYIHSDLLPELAWQLSKDFRLDMVRTEVQQHFYPTIARR